MRETVCPCLTQAGAKPHLTAHINYHSYQYQQQHSEQHQAALAPPRVGMLVGLRKARVSVSKPDSTAGEKWLASRNRDCGVPK